MADVLRVPVTWQQVLLLRDGRPVQGTSSRVRIPPSTVLAAVEYEERQVTTYHVAGRRIGGESAQAVRDLEMAIWAESGHLCLAVDPWNPIPGLPPDQVLARLLAEARAREERTR